MALAIAEFIRRFLIHALPKSFPASATTPVRPTLLCRQHRQRQQHRKWIKHQQRGDIGAARKG
jgi:hypothetical protein